MAAAVVEGVVRETAELRAIRENLLACRMRNWVRLPDEEIWLRNTSESVVGAIVGTWKRSQNVVEAAARSDWLLGQANMRGWAGCFEQDRQEFVAKYGIGLEIMMLLVPHGQELNNEMMPYWDWLHKRVLAPIRDSKPWLYSWIVDNYRTVVDDIVRAAASGRGI